MKKTFIIAALILAAAACHRKAVPAADTTKAPPAPPALPDRPPPSPPPAPDAANAEMVAQGKLVYNGSCGRCHELKPVENYTAERWTGILKSMIPKSRLTDAQAQQVTAYVMANAKK